MGDRTESPSRRGFLAELGYRHVWRAAAVYIGATWALAQGIAQLGPFFGAPDWTVRWFVIACAIGFPFWIAFAWYYKLTPEGIRRESGGGTDDPAFHRATGRKLDFWIIGVMAVAIVLLVTNTFVLHRDATSAANTADTRAALAALAKVPEQSVAVLPLANESGDPKQQYFSDGLSEELISDLTQVNGLKVIGKYSSFKFRDSKDSPAQIGATLGVANLIEGSVRQNGKRIRIVVNLIRAKDGASVWSQSYDQPLKDVFAIQAKIGHAVASALKVKLLGTTIVSDDKPPSGNVQAYQLMLQGRAIARRYSTAADIRQGLALLHQAVKLDPDYAFAWGVISNYEINLGLGYLHGAARQGAIAAGRKAADREYTLAPGTAPAHIDRGYVLSMLDGDERGALREYRRALALAPNSSEAMAALGLQYAVLGQLRKSANMWRKAIAIDPLRADWYASLSGCLIAQGQLDQAEQAVRKTVALQADFPGAYAQLSAIDILRGDAAAAQRDAAKETDPDSKAIALALAQQISGDAKSADAALHDYIAKYGKIDPYNVADLYALRKQPDQMFQWLERARAAHASGVATSLLTDPLLLRYKSDPRFAALCKQLGLPAPDQSMPGAAHPARASSATAATSAGAP